MKYLFNIAYGIGFLYLFGKLIRFVESMDEIKEQVSDLQQELSTLKEFICESESLRKDVETFENSKYSQRHNIFKKGCVCHFMDGRGAVNKNQNDFYTQYNERYLKEPEPDGYGEYTDQKLGGEIYDKFAPLLKELQRIEPRCVTDLHLSWLEKGKKDPRHQARYFDWLIPTLSEKPWPQGKEPVGGGVSSPEAQEILTKFKAEWETFIHPAEVQRDLSET